MGAWGYGPFTTAGAKRVEDILQTLPFREREMIKLLHGIGGVSVYTVDEVARIFKVTRERVRQVEAKAIKRLQHPTRSSLGAPPGGRLDETGQPAADAHGA